MQIFVNDINLSDRLLVFCQCPCTSRSAVVQHYCKVASNFPVLSEHMTETEPKDSTECSFFTMALRLDILITPRARVTVVTIGNPSGMAATARDTKSEAFSASHPKVVGTYIPPIVNISSQGRCCHIPIKQITPITMKDENESFWASSSMLS